MSFEVDVGNEWERRTEMVMPTFSALFTTASCDIELTEDLLGDYCPGFISVLIDKFTDGFILFLCPHTPI